jgi:ribosome-associated protein
VVAIAVSRTIAIDSDELEESFVRASGPGGQNVNKVSTAVQVRLDLARDGSLPAWLRTRARALAGRRVTDAGILVLTAQAHRSQERNRQDALERVVTLLRAAAHRPAIRIASRPTYASQLRRQDEKRRRSDTKRQRTRPDQD